MRKLYISDASQRARKSGGMRGRKFPVLGQVRDVHGRLWNVRDVRATKYGFDLLFGSPANCEIGQVRSLIDTEALFDFWHENRTRHDGILMDLPAGRTTLKRARRRLGFHYREDKADFWLERIADLETRSPREVASLHNVSVGMVFDARLKLLGRQARELGWWRKPEIIATLQSMMTLKQVARKLGISTSQVHRLRLQAKEQYPLGTGASEEPLAA